MLAYLYSFFENVALIKGCVISSNVVYINFYPWYLKSLLTFKPGLIIYPITNSLIHFFVSLNQIKRLAICYKGRGLFAPNNGNIGI